MDIINFTTAQYVCMYVMSWCVFFILWELFVSSKYISYVTCFSVSYIIYRQCVGIRRFLLFLLFIYIFFKERREEYEMKSNRGKSQGLRKNTAGKIPPVSIWCQNIKEIKRIGRQFGSSIGLFSFSSSKHWKKENKTKRLPTNLKMR